MDKNIRFNMINKVAYFAFTGEYNTLDLMWLIGMLSDVRISDDKILKEIEKLKKDFPEYVEVLSISDSLKKSKNKLTFYKVCGNLISRLDN